MNISFFPTVLKEKLIHALRWIKGSFFLILSILLFLAIFTFNINDNSFLTQTSSPASNAVGSIGSHVASFLIYSFGFLSYLIVFFLIINSFATFKRKNYGYFFIRLLLVLVSLVLIPQSFFYWSWDLSYFSPISSWGEIPSEFYNIHQSKWVSYVMSFTGLVLFLATQNVYSLIKFPKFKLNFLKMNNIKDVK